MKEILFRGKRVDNGEWVYGYYVELKYDGGKLGKCGFIYPCTEADYISVAVDPKTIGQYTGLTDKNGKKIFEGDILEQDVVQSGTPHREFVEWDYDLFGNRYDEWSAFFEIIGNIHDNPELLENILEPPELSGGVKSPTDEMELVNNYSRRELTRDAQNGYTDNIVTDYL